jgi:hypothetical protein
MEHATRTIRGSGLNHSQETKIDGSEEKNRRQCQTASLEQGS